MKYSNAVEIGKSCGLTEPAEFVNNIHLHASNLFIYTKIAQELEELDRTAAEENVKFSTVCGHAIIGEDTTDKCYMCHKF